MILRGWSETRETRTIQTSDGFVVANKGDFVFVFVVPRWSDLRRVATKVLDLLAPEHDEKPDAG